MSPKKSWARILMVLDEPFPPDTRIENEARTLIDAGIEVWLLAIGPDERPAEEDFRGIKVVRRRISRQVRNKLRGMAGTVPLLSSFVSREIVRLHRRELFDALHMHDLWLFDAGRKAGRRLGIPVIGDMHENYPEVLSHYAWSTRLPGKLLISIPRWRKLERQWVSAMDRVVYVVDEMRDRCQHFGLPQQHQIVVPNTINMQEVDACDTSVSIAQKYGDCFTIVYTGTINLHRGLDIVIKAMRRVTQEVNAQLVIVGEGRIRPELEELAAASGVASNVQFEGWQARHLLKSYILGSDVCIAPHVKGPHNDASAPHKLFHYMYLRRPVLVTNCVSLERVVRGSNCGLVVPYGSVGNMADALIKLANDAGLARSMGENGHMAVKNQYNWDQTAKPLVQMYHDLVGRERYP